MYLFDYEPSLTNIVGCVEDINKLLRKYSLYASEVVNDCARTNWDFVICQFQNDEVIEILDTLEEVANFINNSDGYLHGNIGDYKGIKTTEIKIPTELLEEIKECEDSRKILISFLNRFYDFIKNKTYFI